MRILVESFKRLYESKRITKAEIQARVESGRITEDEYEYITGEKYSNGEKK